MKERVFIGTGEVIEEENLLEFRLVYTGLLPSSGNSSQGKAQHVIRRYIHPQLRRLWNTDENLRQLAIHEGGRLAGTSLPRGTPDEERFIHGLAAIGKNWRRQDFDCVPLVTPEQALRCRLDILILRLEEPRYVLMRGDLDGHIKTLIDGLRIPDSAGETGGKGPEGDETPLFCLLQDDRLVSEVRVTTDQLLLLPKDFSATANHVHAVIHVRLNHRNARTFGNIFG